HLTGRGWHVTVYCQEDGSGPIRESVWNGIRLVHVPVALKGPKATLAYDLRCVLHALVEEGLVLTLGYNTAVFNLLLKLAGHRNLINMDGLEWRRAKWGPLARAWLYANERFAVLAADRLIADHPEIMMHLRTRTRSDIACIPYAQPRLASAPREPLARLSLEPDGYALVVARPEPENSILEVVQAWSRRKRGCRLVVLGNYAGGARYVRSVVAAASDEVVFPGAIYEPDILAALRFHCRLYLHGHTVGGTNPSLVEAMAAGNAVVAQDNPFNRWVLGDAGRYFTDAGHLDAVLAGVLDDAAACRTMRAAAVERHAEAFTPELVLGAYEALLAEWLPKQPEGTGQWAVRA
ncbi:MAG TPA: glycosyltransferase, partial [Acetobacteraceae bacterium]|nr:glycosyltransferase [Acetobacteraceae bacterium]